MFIQLPSKHGSPIIINTGSMDYIYDRRGTLEDEEKNGLTIQIGRHSEKAECVIGDIPCEHLIANGQQGHLVLATNEFGDGQVLINSKNIQNILEIKDTKTNSIVTRVWFKSGWSVNIQDSCESIAEKMNHLIGAIVTD